MSYYVKEIVRPNYLTMEAEREKVKQIEKKKTKSKTKKKKLLSKLQKRLSSKRILKKSKVELRLPKKEVESVWYDTSRFFKNEMEDAKRSMFLWLQM